MDARSVEPGANGEGSHLLSLTACFNSFVPELAHHLPGELEAVGPADEIGLAALLGGGEWTG